MPRTSFPAKWGTSCINKSLQPPAELLPSPQGCSSEDLLSLALTSFFFFPFLLFLIVPDPMQGSPPLLPSPVPPKVCSPLFPKAERRAVQVPKESQDLILKCMSELGGFHSMDHFIPAGEIVGAALLSMHLQSGQGGSCWYKEGETYVLLFDFLRSLEVLSPLPTAAVL